MNFELRFNTSFHLMKIKPKLQTVTMIASRNKLPPSFWTSMPRKNKCAIMAPAIVPKARMAPYKDVFGIKSKMPETNSTTPDPILPQGSIPKVENICTLTGAAVNLK